MFLFGVNSYQPTLDVAFIVEWTIVKRKWCCIKKRGFQTTQGGHLVIIILLIKKYK